MKRVNAFTLIELLVVISIIALLIGILLPALGAARRTARQMQNSTQVRGIQQGIFIYSQSAKGLYPGVIEVSDVSTDAFIDVAEIDRYSSGGPRAGSHVTARWLLLMEDDYFSPEYAISPGETESDKITEFEPNATTVYSIADNLASFSMPQLNLNATRTANGRIREWSDSASSSAVVISDRLIAPSVNSNVATHISNWKQEAGTWAGSVSYNDNHTEFENNSEVVGTKYIGIQNTLPDNLFADNSPGDQNAVNHANAKQVARGASTTLIQ